MHAVHRQELQTKSRRTEDRARLSSFVCARLQVLLVRDECGPMPGIWLNMVIVKISQGGLRAIAHPAEQIRPVKPEPALDDQSFPVASALKECCDWQCGPGCNPLGKLPAGERGVVMPPTRSTTLQKTSHRPSQDIVQDLQRMEPTAPALAEPRLLDDKEGLAKAPVLCIGG